MPDDDRMAAGSGRRRHGKTCASHPTRFGSSPDSYAIERSRSGFASGSACCSSPCVTDRPDSRCHPGARIRRWCVGSDYRPAIRRSSRRPRTGSRWPVQVRPGPARPQYISAYRTPADPFDDHNASREASDALPKVLRLSIVGANGERALPDEEVVKEPVDLHHDDEDADDCRHSDTAGETGALHVHLVAARAEIRV